MFNQYQEEFRELEEKTDTWISLDQMIQKPLVTSTTQEFDTENQGESNDSKEKDADINENSYETGVTPTSEISSTEK